MVNDVVLKTAMCLYGHGWPLNDLNPPCSDSAAKVLD